MDLVVISRKDLENIISNVVTGIINGVMPTTCKDDSKSEFLTRKDAAEFLGVSIATLDNLVRDGKLKKYKKGGLVRLCRAEVSSFFSSFKKYRRA